MRIVSRLLRSREGGTGGEARPLVLSPSLCHALTLLAQIFGQSWDGFVVGELRRLLQTGGEAPSGQRFAGIFTALLMQSDQHRAGLSDCFFLRGTQIRYRTADRRYTVVIMQGEGDNVLLSWQMNVRGAGTSFITYVVSGTSWRCQEWEVSKECQANLPLLAKSGGEVLGFLYERKLLPEGSIFVKALEEELSKAANLREAARAAAMRS